MSTLMISGPESALEARYHAVPMNPRAPIVIIVPPHPEHEGSMNHAIIHTLFRVFASLGFNVLRFNFRGCGKSQGTFTNGEGEVSDAAACLDWLQSKNIAPHRCWVAGFSFGAYIALQMLMRRPECHSFVCISPPVNLYDFNFLAPCPTPGMIIHPENDDITPKECVIRFVHQLSLQRKGQKINFNIVPQADHAFTSAQKLKQLEALVYAYVAKENNYNLDAHEGILAKV